MPQIPLLQLVLIALLVGYTVALEVQGKDEKTRAFLRLLTRGISVGSGVNSNSTLMVNSFDPCFLTSPPTWAPIAGYSRWEAYNDYIAWPFNASGTVLGLQNVSVPLNNIHSYPVLVGPAFLLQGAGAISAGSCSYSPSAVVTTLTWSMTWMNPPYDNWGFLNFQPINQVVMTGRSTGWSPSVESRTHLQDMTATSK